MATDEKEIPAYVKNKGKLGKERYDEFAFFRTNLVILRASKDISAQKLCEDLNIPRLKRVNDFENGRTHPTFDEIRKIAKYFNVTIDQLMYKRATITFEP